MKRSPAPRLGTTRDACRILDVTDGTARLLARTGELPAAYVLPNGQRIFDLTVVARVARHRVRGRRRPRPPAPSQELHASARVARERAPRQRRVQPVVSPQDLQEDAP